MRLRFRRRVRPRRSRRRRSRPRLGRGVILKRVRYQRGTTKISVDRKRKALPPGLRRSRTGRRYWETRKNRSDLRGWV